MVRIPSFLPLFPPSLLYSLLSPSFLLASSPKNVSLPQISLFHLLPLPLPLPLLPLPLLPLPLLPPPTSPYPPLSSPRWFFVCHGRLVKVYGFNSFEVVLSLRHHTAEVTAVALNPWNRTQLLSAALDGHLAVWDYTDASLLRVTGVI